MSLDKEKLAQEMSTLPLSTISASIAASSTSTAAATSSSISNSTTNYSVQTQSSSTTNPGFLAKVITGAVNNVLSSSANSSRG
ncbi:hypothetical protein F503_03574 [Ophiostoma piceae UAMH 11346]|uniref:Uncharacterized protein n=1 Tax=Ophiostoma piceae (strain UAMH 11346) TaxID=1262450 RepID=S3BVD7_OPHP1|nr:hypothetical protein F503_03574 [Ophiostoma piceae UAMH 11346]